MFRTSYLASLLIILFCGFSLYAQDGNVDQQLRTETIESLGKLLKEKYAYPEMAAKMEADLLVRLKRGEYDKLTDGDAFAKQITQDLRAIFDDKHLNLSYSAKPIPMQGSRSGVPTKEEMEQARVRQGRENFGAVKAEILDGNIGLIQLNYFAPLDWAGDTYSSILNYISNTDALILDLRRNGGSMDVNTIPFFCSYLFERPVLIGDMLVRETNETRQLWTYAKVPGKRYTDKPVYVLTSGRTASGAEAFVSAMRRLKRATIVGEPTRGATMPGGSQRVNEHFTVWISTGRSSSGKVENENKPAQPDVAVAAENALTEAHRLALDAAILASRDTVWTEQLTRVRSSLVRKYEPYKFYQREQ